MTASLTGSVPDHGNMASMIDAFGLMIGRLPQAALLHSDHVTTLFGREPLAFFNMQFIDRPLMDAARFCAAVATAKLRARAMPHPSFFGICPNWCPANAEVLLSDAGFAPAMTVTGMAADTLLPPRRPLPELTWRLAPEPGVAEALGHINALAYGMPPGDFGAIAEPALWELNSFGVVGHDETGRAVTATGSILVGDIIYIAYVATLPDCHGRGYAEAVMREAIRLAEAAGGKRRIWLHATAMGQPVYAAMGFATGTGIPLYALG